MLPGGTQDSATLPQSTILVCQLMVYFQANEKFSCSPMAMDSSKRFEWVNKLDDS